MLLVIGNNNNVIYPKQSTLPADAFSFNVWPHWAVNKFTYTNTFQSSKY